MKKKARRLLWGVFWGALVLCMGVFIWITVYMQRQSDAAIHHVGTIYMSQMSTQLKLQFGLLIDSHLSQVQELVKRTSSDADTLRPEVLEELTADGSYTYLGLYDTDGPKAVLCGEAVEIIDEAAFLNALSRGEKQVTAGTTTAGEKLLLLGVPAACKMGDGGQSDVLVAGFPMEHLQDSMSLDIGETLVYSHFIRKDGRFILRNADATEDSYFDRIRTKGQSPGRTPQELTEAMEQAVAKGEDFSVVVTFGDERRSTYLTPLPYSDWYLVSVMPYGTLEEPIVALSRQRILTTLAGCGIILLTLLTVFFLYFRLSQRQMAALDEARQRADSANRAKSEFLSNMSHDIRTPMNAIVGMTAIASTNLHHPERVRNCLQKIEFSSKHLLGLINDVLDMSKIESGKLSLNMDRLSLRETVDSIINIVHPQIKAKSQQFDVFLQHVDTEDVYGDGVRLNQVLLNLLSNAIKFTPDGGCIALTMRQEASPAGDAFVRLHFFVKDTGIGMSEAFRDKLFEAFERENSSRVSKTEGTGLGMAITKYIVDAMKGTIAVISEPGVGSEFHVTLDLEKAPTASENMRLPAWNILIVDDDEQVCRNAAASLEDMGAFAEWALDGESALRMAAVRHKANEGYQIILLDWNMPGLNGLETARRLRQQIDGGTPILLISAYEWTVVEEEAKTAGISGFVSKPLFQSTLFYALRRCMGDESGQQTVPAEDSRPDLSGRRILLAEDNDLNWEIADTLLSEHGLLVERAENGRICLEKFIQSAPGFYDAVLMDIRMPEMNGYEATKAIRETSRSDAALPIIAMTADAFAEDIQQCLASGMTDHIAKPIDIAGVLQILQKYLPPTHDGAAASHGHAI